MQPLIFSDLDGTLLNHDDYSFRGAIKALTCLRVHNIPLILNTSKTAAEVEWIRHDLENDDPFIVENGACIITPHKRIVLGTPYQRLRDALDHFPHRHYIRGFGDMEVDEVIAHTGLSAPDARHAMRREFSEPFLLEDERRLPDLLKAAQQHQLRIIKGGRFYHLMGLKHDKGDALQHCVELMRPYFNTSTLLTVALGDSENDRAMLNTADIPCLIRKPNGRYLEDTPSHTRRSKAVGSEGWQEIIEQLLKEWGYGH